MTAELKRADFKNWSSSVPSFISWIYKSKVERSKTIATRKKKDNENLGALENIYRGRQTGVKQEAKRPIKENKISIDEKISCH